MRLLRKSQEAPLQDCTPLTLNPTWRFMGSYKWGYKSPNKAYTSILTLLKTLLITTHEPPSAPGSASLQLWEYRNQKSLNLSTICTLNPNGIRGQGQKKLAGKVKNFVGKAKTLKTNLAHDFFNLAHQFFGFKHQNSWAKSKISWPKLSKRTLPTNFLTLPTNFFGFKHQNSWGKARGPNFRVSALGFRP